MTFVVKTDINLRACAERIEKNIQRVQAKLDAQVLKDSNYYCPQQTGILQKSSIMSTVIGSGCVKWTAPYAKSRYYALRAATNRNPNACPKWFEAAKAAKLREWEMLVHAEYGKGSH